MSFVLKLPNITAPSASGKIEQIRGYLYQLTEQLEWALNSIESSKDISKSEAQATFNSIKSLIINSAEIVEAYSEKISKTLSGKYTYANKDFNELKHNTGYYIDSSRPSDLGCSNYPVDITGVLEVIALGEFAYQTYKTHEGEIYFRSYVETVGWTAWKKVTLT